MIHDTAIIDSTATIAPEVTIGPYAVIGANVTIGEGTWVGPHVVINGPTTIGRNNRFFQFSSIGEQTQDKKFFGEETHLEIGDNNTFRECTTVNRGAGHGGGVTRIGNNNLLMAYVHIAHDCIVGNNIVFSNNASLAGHVHVDDFANLGGFVGVHQFSEIGAYSFCAGGSIINKDVPPYVMVSGHPANVRGLNLVGLKRREFTEQAIVGIKEAYRLLYRQGLTVEEAAKAMESIIQETPEVQPFQQFALRSERGIVR